MAKQKRKAKRASMTSNSLSDLLTISEAANFLGVSVSTLRNWDHTGKLKAVRHPMNNYRLYERNSLEMILRSVLAETVDMPPGEDRE